jgi:hypothetical protein
VAPNELFSRGGLFSAPTFTINHDCFLLGNSITETDLAVNYMTEV